jgi:uncharacterized protein YndB with AHSA1/START domain
MTFHPSPVVPVQAQDVDGQWTLVFVRELKHAPEKVWRALTEPAQVERWAPYETDRDLGTPGEATLTMIDADTRVPMAAQVVTADRPTVLEYTWGTDVLRWELAPIATGTRLTLKHTVADQDLLPKVAAGWHLCLDVAERLLDGDPMEPIRGRAAYEFGWQALNDAYAKELGLS